MRNHAQSIQEILSATPGAHQGRVFERRVLYFLATKVS